MRVVSWNVQTARPNPDGPADVGRAMECLRSLDADVYAVQELDRSHPRSGRTDQPTVLADGLGGHLAWAPTVSQARGAYGIALIVRGDILATRVVPLSGTHEPRALLLAHVEVRGRRWTVGCTHLSRDRDFARRQLLRVFDTMAAHASPRILLGDLNLTPTEVLPWSTSEGYQLVDGPATHSTRQASITRRIDHILLSGTTAARASVHRFAVSDHCAVSADLT